MTALLRAIHLGLICVGTIATGIAAAWPRMVRTENARAQYSYTSLHKIVDKLIVPVNQNVMVNQKWRFSSSFRSLSIRSLLKLYVERYQNRV